MLQQRSQDPISKPLCPKEQVFLPGKRGVCKWRGCLSFHCCVDNKQAACSSNLKIKPFPWVKMTWNVTVLFIRSLSMCTLRIQNSGRCHFVDVIQPCSGTEGQKWHRSPHASWMDPAKTTYAGRSSVRSRRFNVRNHPLLQNASFLFCWRRGAWKYTNCKLYSNVALHNVSVRDVAWWVWVN